MPVVTLLYAGLFGLMAIAVAIPAGRLRSVTGISVGDGGNPDLVLAMRRHANFVEWVPIALILIGLLEMNGVCSFTDYFLICSGTSSRQMQAVCDAIHEDLKKGSAAFPHIEGYPSGEWILMDYLDFVVHIFSSRAREFYDLERLWRAATRIPLAGDEKEAKDQPEEPPEASEAATP